MSVRIDESRSHQGTIGINHFVGLDFSFWDVAANLVDLPAGNEDIYVVVSDQFILRIEADYIFDVSKLDDFSEASVLNTLVYIIKRSHLFNNKML